MSLYRTIPSTFSAYEYNVPAHPMSYVPGTIRDKVKELGLTQIAAAARCKVSRGTMHTIMHDEVFSAKTIIAVATGLFADSPAIIDSLIAFDCVRRIRRFGLREVIMAGEDCPLQVGDEVRFHSRLPKTSIRRTIHTNRPHRVEMLYKVWPFTPHYLTTVSAMVDTAIGSMDQAQLNEYFSADPSWLHLRNPTTREPILKHYRTTLPGVDLVAFLRDLRAGPVYNLLVSIYRSNVARYLINDWVPSQDYLKDVS